MVAQNSKARAMRKLAILFLFALIASPALAAKRISIKQLDKSLSDTQNKSDQDLAKWLFSLELTERVPPQTLDRWRREMPGKKSAQALTALADSSNFLSLPTDEIPKTPPLDANAQHQLLDQAASYIETTLSKLPNFFANQTIDTFEDVPASQDGMNYYPYEPFHFDSSRNAIVYYRNGKEVMETHKGQEVIEDGQTISFSSGLLSSGEFGPVLRTVLSDAKNGKLHWSHWEPGTSIPAIAVFNYSVPHSKSHYKVKLEMPGNATPFQVRPGYHGEIAIDPSNGTILRITLKAELNDTDPLSQADLLVEYGAVEIGARQYICPIRSTALVHVVGEIRVVGRSADYAPKPTSSNALPFQTILNDVAFTRYQVLRTEAKILTGADTEDSGDPQ